MRYHHVIERHGHVDYFCIARMSLLQQAMNIFVLGQYGTMRIENDFNPKKVGRGVKIFDGKLCHKLISEFSKGMIIITC